MEIKNAQYVSGAAEYGQCLVSDLPQIAVLGKSNVGKSSFINYLTGDGKLARTSKTPGRTRLVNYFLINEGSGEFLLTDLPGYGYAKVSEGEKNKWADLLEGYLGNEPQLVHVLFLVDIRHDPTADDKIMYNYLYKSSLPFTVIATKADKLSKSAAHLRVIQVAAALKIGIGNVIAVSSTEKYGKEAVLEKIEQAVTYSRENQNSD